MPFVSITLERGSTLDLTHSSPALRPYLCSGGLLALSVAPFWGRDRLSAPLRRLRVEADTCCLRGKQKRENDE